MTLALEYRLRSGLRGTGEAVNMSSSGLFFRCGRELPLGELLEVDIQWPIPLQGTWPLRLRVSGIVVRSEPGAAAMSISKYEFFPVE